MNHENNPEKISQDDLSYLQALLEQQKALQAAMQPYEFHLAKKYKLNQGDRIEDDGTIVRASNIEVVKGQGS